MRLKHQGEILPSEVIGEASDQVERTYEDSHLEGLKVLSACGAEQHPWAEITVS